MAEQEKKVKKGFPSNGRFFLVIKIVAQTVPADVCMESSRKVEFFFYVFVIYVRLCKHHLVLEVGQLPNIS